jgi:hypothetical protein
LDAGFAAGLQDCLGRTGDNVEDIDVRRVDVGVVATAAAAPPTMRTDTRLSSRWRSIARTKATKIGHGRSVTRPERPPFSRFPKNRSDFQTRVFPGDDRQFADKL